MSKPRHKLQEGWDGKGDAQGVPPSRQGKLTPEQLYELRTRADYPHVPTFGADLRKLLAHIDAQQARIAELEQDAARYRWLTAEWIGERFNAAYSKWDGHTKQGFDTAADSLMPGTHPDYASRSAVSGQNGNDGLHYPEGKP